LVQRKSTGSHGNHESSQFDGTDGILGILDDASKAGALVTFEFVIEWRLGLERKAAGVTGRYLSGATLWGRTSVAEEVRGGAELDW
jgi:hypothetical protein